MTDLRLAFRTIAKQPGMALAAVVALALGIGLTTTMFSIVNGAVLRGLPFPESDRILHMAPFNIAEQDDVDTRIHTFAEFRSRQRSFEQLGAFRFMAANVVGPDGIPERYRASQVTSNMFRLLRVAPILGRDFRDEESRPGAARAVIIGEKVWRERLNGSPDAVGQPLRVNGELMTVVGVMPETFRFPMSQDLWPALIVDPDNTKIGEGPALEVIGRLKPGVTRDQAAAEMATLWHQLELEHPDRYKGYTTEVKSYIAEFLGGEIITTLFTMLAAVFGVLIIACANVANLVLARAADRTREIAVRTALGAARARVIRQMLVEVLLLAVMGGLAGIAIAQIGVTLFNRAIVDTTPPFWIDIRIDQTVLLFVTMATIAAAIAAGLIPALRASRTDLMAVMNDEGRGVSSLRMGRFSKGLVIAEIAVSFGLLVASGLMIQSIANVARMEFGFAISDVLSARLVLNEQDYPSEERRRQFADAALARLQTLPGARNVALTSNLPLGGPRYAVKLPGRQYATDRDYHDVHGVIVSPGFFETLRVPVQGRGFDARDIAGGLPTVIVNESFARRYYPQGAIGQRVALATGEHQQWRTIVGVVPDLGMGRAPGDRLVDAIYLPMAQMPPSFITLLVHAAGAPLGLTAAVRDAVRALDPNLPVFDVKTIQQALEGNAWAFRVFGSLFLAFGFAALFLAMVGLYGVMAFSVSRRTQEIGVRMAVGAAGRDVLTLVLRQGLVQMVAGILLGIGLAALLTTGLKLLLFGVNPYDPVIFTGTAVVLALTGAAACLVPARRAAAVDPMTALRYQ